MFSDVYNFTKCQIIHQTKQSIFFLFSVNVIETTDVRHTSMLNDFLIAGIQLIGKSAKLKEDLAEIHSIAKNREIDYRTIMILEFSQCWEWPISIHILVLVKRNLNQNFQEPLFIKYYNRFDTVLTTSLLYRN